VMQTIIICVLGGTNPNGGFGKVRGVVIAILILQVLSSGFNMFPQISNFYRNIIWGAVLILVVVYNHLSENYRVKKLAKAAQNS
jgi:simple sugar transport system permease protein